MYTVNCTATYLKLNEGSFVNDNNETIDYRKARFLSEYGDTFTLNCKDIKLPPSPMTPCTLIIDFSLGDKFCRANLVECDF